jgi:hypothetical protein
MSGRLEVVETRVRHGEGEFFKRLPGARSVELAVIENPEGVLVETRAYEGSFMPDSTEPSGQMLLSWGEIFPTRDSATLFTVGLKAEISESFPGIGIVVKDGLIPVETSAKQ